MIADETVDGELCATDLLGQAEHGPDLAGHPAHQLRAARPGRPSPRSSACSASCRPPPSPPSPGRDYGEVIVCDSEDEMVAEADRIASEHVQVMTRDADFFLQRHDQLRLAVPGAAHQRRLRGQGDRHQPHAAHRARPPATRAGCGSASSSRPCTWQRVLTDQAAAEIGARCSRLCALEGFAAHGEQANIRVRRYGGRNVPVRDGGGLNPAPAVAPVQRHPTRLS